MLYTEISNLEVCIWLLVLRIRLFVIVRTIFIMRPTVTLKYLYPLGVLISTTSILIKTS